MKKKNGEIVCDKCGLSLGKYETTATKHYCTTCSFYRDSQEMRFWFKIAARNEMSSPPIPLSFKERLISGWRKLRNL